MGTIGDNIAALRDQRGLNKAELARRMKVAPSAVTAWEKGRYKTLEVKTLLALAVVLKCSVDDLLDGFDADYDAVVRDLPRHSVPAQSEAAIQEAAGAAASSRSLDRQRVLALADHADTAIEQLVRLSAELRREAQTPGATAPRSSRRHRAPR